MGRKKKMWIQKLKKGAYREHLVRLGVIKEDDKIPVELSKKICDAEIGEKISYKQHKIKVTELLKRRACTHLTLNRLRKKKK